MSVPRKIAKPVSKIKNHFDIINIRKGLAITKPFYIISDFPAKLSGAGCNDIFLIVYLKSHHPTRSPRSFFLVHLNYPLYS